MEAFKTEMLMRDIPDHRRLSGFAQVVMLSIHAEVHEIQDDCRNWSEFEERLLERYAFNESLWLSKKELMEWVELPGKGRNTMTLLQEFER